MDNGRRWSSSDANLNVFVCVGCPRCSGFLANSQEATGCAACGPRVVRACRAPQAPCGACTGIGMFGNGAWVLGRVLTCTVYVR